MTESSIAQEKAECLLAVGAELREAISSGSEILGSWGPQILLFYGSDLILEHVTNIIMAGIHPSLLVPRHSLSFWKRACIPRD